MLKVVGSAVTLALSTGLSSDCQSANTDEKVILRSNSSVPCSTEETWSHPVVEVTMYSGFEPLLAFHMPW